MVKFDSVNSTGKNINIMAYLVDRKVLILTVTWTMIILSKNVIIVYLLFLVMDFPNIAFFTYFAHGVAEVAHLTKSQKKRED